MNKLKNTLQTKTAPGPFGRASVMSAVAFGSFREARFSLQDQIFFAKRLSFLMNAGVTTVEGLGILRDQMTSKTKSRLVGQILSDVANGQSLAKSFGKFPKAFGDFMIHIVKIGESSGTLSQNLEYLSEELKKKLVLRRKIVSAFIYPALIVVATFGITAFLMLYLFPKIMPVFVSLHAELPFTTRVVMSASIFFQHWGLYVLVAVALGILGLTTLVGQSASLHLALDHLVLRLPIIGMIVRYYNIANMSRTLGLLLKSGVKLSEALPIISDTTKNLAYKRECLSLADVVNRGERISVHLHKRPYLFPAIFAHMVAVGEKSGTLSKTLSYLSEMYESEVEDFTKNLSTLIEPALMIFMGVLVGFVAVSIITPIYGLTQSLHG